VYVGICLIRGVCSSIQLHQCQQEVDLPVGVSLRQPRVVLPRHAADRSLALGLIIPFTVCFWKSFPELTEGRLAVRFWVSDTAPDVRLRKFIQSGHLGCHIPRIRAALPIGWQSSSSADGIWTKCVCANENDQRRLSLSGHTSQL